MGTRGRKSAASLSVISGDPLQTIPRPEPLSELTDEQAAEWRIVVGRMPADWFPPETHALLAQYCRHVIRARRLAQMLDAMEQGADFDLAAYDKLLKAEEIQSRAIGAIATRMRITHQATVRHEQARKPSMVSKPWQA